LRFALNGLATFVVAEFNTKPCAIENPEKMAIGTRRVRKTG